MKEKLSRFALSLMLALALYAAFLPTASADDLTESLHVAVDGTGAYLFSISGEISEGDEYISADNILYRIATVQNGNAIAEKIGEEAMPDVSWLEVGEAQPVFALGNRRARCQHKVRRFPQADCNVRHPQRRKLCALRRNAERQRAGRHIRCGARFPRRFAATGDRRDSRRIPHPPHDSGAYRRSRQTAERLLQKGPDAIIDIHRDGIPDQNEYACSIDGENASRVRLLVDAPIRTAQSTGNSPSRSKPWQTNNIPVW